MEGIEIKDYVIAAAIVLYGAYLTFKSVHLYFVGQKAKKEFKKTHKGYEEVNQAQLYFYMFVVLCIVGIVMIFISTGKDVKELFYFRVAYLMMVIVCSGMALDSLSKRHAIFDENGFFYEKSYFRFRSISGIDRNKGLMRNMQIHTLDEDKIMISKKMGQIFDERYENWRKRKKNKTDK